MFGGVCLGGVHKSVHPLDPEAEPPLGPRGKHPLGPRGRHLTYKCKNITLPQTLFSGCKKQDIHIPQETDKGVHAVF